MKKPARAPVRATTGSSVLRPDHFREHVTHPEWFHVFKDSADSEMKINVNVYRLPAPARAMVADWAGAARKGTVVSLVFGQMPPGAHKMTGALIVQMPVERAREAFFKNPEFLPAIQKYANENKIVAERRVPRQDLYPVERIVTERATMLFALIGEDDAELRFYFASRSDVQAILQGQKADVVHPLVEVRMPAEEMVHLVETVRALMGDEEKP